MTTASLNAKPGELAVMLWANAAVAGSGLPASKFYGDFPKSRRLQGREVQSQAFASCIAKGRPVPQLFLEDGSDGPAMKIEQQVPGTLKWLIHPMYEVLENLGQLSIEAIHRAMVMTEEEVMTLLFRRRGTQCRRRENDNIGDVLAQLRALGTLDAMAGMFYLSVEADLRVDRSAALAIERFAQQHLKTWTCLSWTSRINRERLTRMLLAHMQPRPSGHLARDEALAYHAGVTLGRLAPHKDLRDLEGDGEAFEFVIECMEGMGVQPVMPKRAIDGRVPRRAKDPNT